MSNGADGELDISWLQVVESDCYPFIPAVILTRIFMVGHPVMCLDVNKEYHL